MPFLRFLVIYIFNMGGNDKMNKCIAIVGMCGSGKSIATEYFEKLGYEKIYFGGVTMQKLKEEGLAVTPENEKMMREKLRQELGMGAFAKILLPQIMDNIANHAVVLDGVYSWDEVKILQENIPEMITIAIVCDKSVRYERLKTRKVRPLTNQQAIARDIAEIENSDKGGPIAYADYYVLNNGTFDEYYKRLDKIIKEVNKNEEND